MYLSTILSLGLVASGVVSALPAQQQASRLEARATFPFTQMVGFGDNLSDNGNGSWAHGVANRKNPSNTIYGFKTWTNGPVAISYLSTLLGVPLTADYAFGGADGGSRIGATINNSYTASPYAQDAFQQVDNYTTSRGFTTALAAQTLHFLWIGNNDISLLHLSVLTGNNAKFASEMAAQMDTLVGRLVANGANYIFVPAIYPKNLTPFRKYIASNDKQIANLGLAIQQANAAIKKKLAASYGRKVIYYDAFSFMTNLYNNHDQYGIDYVLPRYCDGYSAADWKNCVTQKHGDEYYWMQQTDPTTRVHYLVAQDMAATITNAFA